MPDEEGLFCLFCGRTAGEHTGAASADGERNLSLLRSRTDDIAGAIDEEDDWDAIQDELRRLTKRCQQEAAAGPCGVQERIGSHGRASWAPPAPLGRGADFRLRSERLCAS